ncbi:MAG: terminase family protein [Clostridia bacterium]|nr:terminase family protein [Clostridia bacterium]
MIEKAEIMTTTATQREIITRLRLVEKRLADYKSKNRLEFYNKDKVHEKQMQFHRSTKKNRWVFGGNRSGKTECGAVEAVWRARGIHPFDQNRHQVDGWVVSLTREVQREVAQRKILHYLNPDWIENVVMVSGRADYPEGGVIDYITVKTVTGGKSRICFKSCEMGREKFQGASLDFVWFDEEPPEDIYDECLMRVMDKKGYVFGTMTPLKGLTFVYYRIFLNGDDEDIWHISMEWADNPYLDQNEVKKKSATMSEDSLLRRRYGKFVGVSGPVYPEFDQSVHVIEPFDVPKDWYDNISIDPGLSNPLSCHFYARDGDGNVYVIAEHYQKDKDVCYHADRIKEICALLGWKKDRSGRINALIDSAANQRTLASQKSVAELFFEQGIAVCPKVNKDVTAGIHIVKRFLGEKKLFIFKTCTNMIREIKGYVWGEGESPKKVDDHAMDELRYYLASLVPKKKTESEIARDKQKLLKHGRKYG